MNIAIIVRRLNIRGGTQRMVAHLAHHLKEQGHQVTLYTFFYDKNECYPELLDSFSVVEGDKTYTEQMRQAGSLRGIGAFLKRYLLENRAARNLADKIGKDVHVLNPHDQLAYRVAAFYKKGHPSVPSVWMMNDMSTKKTSLLRNSEFDTSIRVSFLKRAVYWAIDAYEYFSFIRYQDIVAVLDGRDKRWADEQFRGTRNVIIRNGLDAEEFPFKEHRGISGKKIRMLAVAILLPHRRFEDCITAVSLLRKRGWDATLSIAGSVGDSKYSDKLKSLVGNLSLQRHVNFVGHAGREELLNLYHSSDVFVFPCHLQSWGLVVFEAMAAGLPVIVSRTAGASEVLTSGKDSFVVPPYSPEAIADATEALAKDGALYRSMSKSGRKFVEENISWDRYTDAMLGFFEEARKKYA